MSWARMRDRMDARVVSHLKDGHARYLPADGRPPVDCIEVIVEHNVLQAGPEGFVRTNQTSITWRKVFLDSADRGDHFEHCGKRYLVEDRSFDDGHMVTAMCMEVP